MQSKTELDLVKIPFSRRESNLAISWLQPEPDQFEGLWLRFIYGGQGMPVFCLQALKAGEVLEPAVDADPCRMRLSAGTGYIEIVMPAPNAVRIRGRGLGLRLTAFDDGGKGWGALIPAGERRWRAIVGSAKLLFTPLAGAMNVHAPWAPADGVRHRHHRTYPMRIDFGEDAMEWESQINAYESEVDPPEVVESFQQGFERVRADFAAWSERCPAAPERYSAARDLAAYVTWSAVVPAAGNYRAPAMVMSKNWMVNTWNWDNYINAWASVYRDVDFAWNQYMLHIGHQHGTGALGDAINEQVIGWSYTKPPVHGWILRRMMEASDKIDSDRIRQVYQPLCRWTEWWFRYRDDDRDGICQYHHGNDSGWDDASAFDVGSPNEAPDLNSLLILQMDVLGDLAETLGEGNAAAGWRKRSSDMLHRFLKHSWRDGQFVSMVSGTHLFDRNVDSLLNYIPLVLGRRLPKPIRKDMIEGLTREGRFMTDWGLATEAVDSPEYLPRGYWRGSIWPPPMLMIVDGLHDAGETMLSEDLAERFCRLTATHGFGENHDALTGEVHYDPAYTWSASVFQLFAHLYLHHAPANH